MCSSFVRTAIFDLEPASLAIAFISIVPAPSSGDSVLNNSSQNFGCDLEILKNIPFGVSSTL
jgi:hypothetical protein